MQVLLGRTSGLSRTDSGGGGAQVCSHRVERDGDVLQQLWPELLSAAATGCAPTRLAWVLLGQCV